MPKDHRPVSMAHCPVPLGRRLWLSLLTTLTTAVVLLHLLVLDLGDDPDLRSIPVAESAVLRKLYVTGPRRGENRTLLTLFTTMDEQHPEKAKLHLLTLNNWASFIQEGVRPVLFSTLSSSRLLMEAYDLGWDILPLNRTNRYGLPYIRDLHSAAYSKYSSHFFAYANGDILFDDTLVRTLHFLRSSCARGHVDPQRLYVVGMRTNIPVDGTNPPQEFSDVRLVQKLARREKPTEVYAMDYFLTSQDGGHFPWSRIPDVVVGRIEYDMHLLITAMDAGMHVIDATRTLHAVHLRAVQQSWPLKTPKIKDNLFNHAVLGDGWDLKRGRVDSSQYLTDFCTSNSSRNCSSNEEDIILVRRTQPIPHQL